MIACSYTKYIVLINNCICIDNKVPNSHNQISLGRNKKENETIKLTYLDNQCNSSTKGSKNLGSTGVDSGSGSGSGAGAGVVWRLGNF